MEKILSPDTPIKFPMPESMVPNLELTHIQVKAYRKIAHDIVSKTLEQECDYRYIQREELSDHDWKFLKKKERLRIFKRITPSTPEEPLLPMVLGIGILDGTIENVFYGLHHKTTDEMRTTTSFINKSLLDCAVLLKMDKGTDKDPYRQLALKWRVAQTPGPNIIKNRDVINLEAMGVDVDEHGQKYGFHLLKSVDVPGFPPFSDNVIVRSQMMLCCIYRQLTPTTVTTYCKGVFNLGGDLAEFMAYNTSCDMVLSIAKSVDAAASKRLTLMLLQQQANRINMPPLTSRTTSDTGTHSSGMSLGNKHQNNHSLPYENECDRDHCALCSKKVSKLRLLGSSARTCKVCMHRVCSKCYVKRYVFAKPENFKIVCCKVCMLEAKTLHVDPRDPYPMLYQDIRSMK